MSEKNGEEKIETNLFWTWQNENDIERNCVSGNQYFFLAYDGKNIKFPNLM